MIVTTTIISDPLATQDSDTTEKPWRFIRTSAMIQVTPVTNLWVEASNKTCVGPW